MDKKWLVGLVDVAGSFNVYVSEERGLKKVLLEFKIELKTESDLSLLYNIKKFFGYGQVISNRAFVIRNIVGLRSSIIPFFEVNTLKSSKRFEFFKFRRCLFLLVKRNRVTDGDLQKVLKLKGIVKKL